MLANKNAEANEFSSCVNFNRAFGNMKILRTLQFHYKILVRNCSFFSMHSYVLSGIGISDRLKVLILHMPLNNFILIFASINVL